MTSPQPYIVVAAGGTGGHMMPAEAVTKELQAQGAKVTLVTDKRGDDIVNACVGMKKLVLPASSHTRGGMLGKVSAIWSILKSAGAVKAAFKKVRPDVVVGFGGYPSLPAVLAARSLNIPYVLHEQNAVLGRVNRKMAKGASLVALSVEKTSLVPKGVKTIVTGNPLRQSIAEMANIAYAVPLGLGNIRLFVLGGSQGARILSDVVPAALAQLSDEYRGRLEVIHQARPENVDNTIEVYKAAGIKATVKSYFEDVGSVLLRTQLVICRSGASTLAELTATGRPAILVPLAIAVDDHQAANATLVSDAAGGWVMTENEFTPENLAEKLIALFDDVGILRDASENIRKLAMMDAAHDLAAQVMQIKNRKGSEKCAASPSI